MLRFIICLALSVAGIGAAHAQSVVPNNQCVSLQTDPWGNAQCGGPWLDSGGNAVIGYDDPRLIRYAKSPENFQRAKVEDNFCDPGLAPRWTVSLTGTGSVTDVGPCKVSLNTGANGTVTIWLRKFYTAVNWDARAYFFLEVPTASIGFQSTKFPYDYSAAYFRRYDAGSPSKWYAMTVNAAGAAKGVPTALGDDYQRRIGIVSMKGDHVDYFVGANGTSANGLANLFDAVPDASIAIDLPLADAPLTPFVYVAGSNRSVVISNFAVTGSD